MLLKIAELYSHTLRIEESGSVGVTVEVVIVTLFQDG